LKRIIGTHGFGCLREIVEILSFIVPCPRIEQAQVVGSNGWIGFKPEIVGGDAPSVIVEVECRNGDRKSVV
jgi:hypothetical protein